MSHRKFVERTMDDISTVPTRTAACAAGFVQAIDYMIEVMWKMSYDGNVAMLLSILDDPGVAQCEWQPTKNWYDRSSEKVFKNSGISLFHGKKAKNAPGFNVWGQIVHAMRYAITEKAYCFLAPGEGFSKKSWQRCLTFPESNRMGKRPGVLWGQLDLAHWAHSAVCKSGSSRDARHQVKRLVAMFGCQMKKWSDKLVEDIGRAQENMVDGATENLLSAGITEPVFMEQLRASAVKLGVDSSEYRGRTMKEMLRASFTVETAGALVRSIGEAVL
eukprot:TRINITY_DN6033_c0_g1_i2.p1 TRINITY_DN6033_c0_g1~~TRINITY_DN6033_c0_g1_i2.p1  ORF type:complete len:274 (-),score=23.08 TRINITY_DN6033_c0_g1_i2:210-1031(-)